MDEDKIEDLKEHLKFSRSLYDIAGDWGDIPYAKLNAMVRYFEEELKKHDSNKSLS